MDRCTERNVYGDARIISGMERRAAERLASYEDLGLSPLQVKLMKAGLREALAVATRMQADIVSQARSESVNQLVQKLDVIGEEPCLAPN